MARWPNSCVVGCQLEDLSRRRVVSSNAARCFPCKGPIIQAPLKLVKYFVAIPPPTLRRRLAAPEAQVTPCNSELALQSPRTFEHNSLEKSLGCFDQAAGACKVPHRPSPTICERRARCTFKLNWSVRVSEALLGS
eukprot:3425806-Amphidinium_carterae.1